MKKVLGFFVVLLALICLCSCASTQKPVKHVYIASPFFNDVEYDNVVYVESLLEKRGLSYFSPMRHNVDAEAGSLDWAYKIFELDRTEILKADAVVAIYYGSEGDTGTAWECGYAIGNGIPVILVHVDVDNGSNLMVNCGSTTNITLEDLINYDFDNLPIYEYEGMMI